MKISRPELEIYCITNKRIKILENFSYNLCWVGSEVTPAGYLSCDKDDNIFFKEKYYSELTFQYWYWKNLLSFENKNWIGFCQKRRFWLKKKNINKISQHNFKESILNYPDEAWNNYDSIICNSIKLNKVNKSKILKRGFRNFLRNPKILFNEEERNISLHFDMHHGYGNLEKAINVMDIKDREDFREYVNSKTFFNPHIMFISRSHIIHQWFNDLFNWLFECEKVFGFNILKGYDTTRLYAYLAERYLSFWFKKYTNYLEWEWVFYDNM